MVDADYRPHCGPPGSLGFMDREDSSHPLLSLVAQDGEDTTLLLMPGNAGGAAPGPDGLPFASEQKRVVEEALCLIEGQLESLKGRGQVSRAETSELLRDTCQTLSDLAMGLDQTWRKTYPDEPQPQWHIEVIPEEELARIGWDFHANRVQILNTGGSFWDSVAYLFKADQQGSFAKPPSAPAVVEALSRTRERLGAETT